MDCLRGIPLFEHGSVGIQNRKVCAFQFFLSRDVGLADLHLRRAVFDQDMSAFNLGSVRLDLAGLVDDELRVGSDGVAVGCNSLTQDVLYAGLQAVDLVSLIRGCPLLDDYIFILFTIEFGAFGFVLTGSAQDLDIRAGQFRTAGNFYLANSDVGLVVVDQDMAAFDFCAVCGDLTVHVNRELRVSSNGIAVGCNGLTQDVFLARLQAFNVMRCSAGSPLLDYHIFIVFTDILCVIRFVIRRLAQQLDLSAGQFFLAGDIGLAHIHLGDGIFNQDDSALGDAAGSRYITGCVDHEGGFCSDRVAQRCHSLLQGVGLAGMQTLHFMDVRCGIPLFNDRAILVDDLDMCAFQLCAVGNIHLADLHFSQRVFDQDDSAFSHGTGSGYITVCVNHEGGFCSDRVAQRRHSLLQGVGLAGMQAVHFMDVRCGIPLFNDRAILVDDLDMCAFQLCAVGNIHLADLHFSQRVFDQDDSAFSHGTGSGYITVCVNHEGGFCSDRVAQRRHSLLQGIGLAGMQAVHFMDILRGCPLFNDLAVLVQDLDMRAFQFCTVSNVNLADLHVGDAVGNGISPGIIRSLGNDRSLIASNLCFRYGVLDLCIVIQLDQVTPGILPAVFCIQHNSFAKVGAVCLQLNLNTLGSDAALIVIVIPDLFNSNFCRFQRIRNTVSADDLLETGNFFFFNCVLDFSRAIRTVLR